VLVTWGEVERRAKAAIKTSITNTTKFAQKAAIRSYVTMKPSSITHHQLVSRAGYSMAVSSTGLGYIGTVIPTASPHQSIVNPAKYKVIPGSLAYLYEYGHRYNLRTRTKDPAFPVIAKVQADANNELRKELLTNFAAKGFRL